jgi:hypothetical protein
MPGVPPILFPVAADDDEGKVRKRAEDLLNLLLPED